MVALKRRKASLVLEDGSEFCGFSFGAVQPTSGEVVFNTGMVGYPESLTDPSYRGQILVLTYPLIGNYGVPGDEARDGLMEYLESERVHVKGLVVTNYSTQYSHWNAKRSLSEWLKGEGIPAITGIDTRELTQKLRRKGTMLGRITFGTQMIQLDNPNRRNIAAEVTIREPIQYGNGAKRIVLIDCGTKASIIKAFLDRGLSIYRIPFDHDLPDNGIDGIIISNGPGNPKQCKKTIASIREAVRKRIPILGICLGSQILGLAIGANTYKLKYGHRSQNQPCVETGTKRCYITSQNHGYAIDANTLPLDWREWFYNNNDGTNEGIIHISKPFFGAQFHPEASPGPDDTEFIFDMFVRAL
jgi:carbamoyl-phosphate synthase small subunit